jgi:transcriptional regulator with XRE-family HTH domain
VSNADEVREFLTTRRSRITPDRAGLPHYGRSRRVPGLRREEVALLAGISDIYYTKIERGDARGVSQDVLDGLARALQLDAAERAHLDDLVRTANLERPWGRTKRPEQVRPGVRRIVDLFGGPALVRNRRLDILYANQLGAAFYSEIYHRGAPPPNTARYAFLDPRSHDFYVDWDAAAQDMAALLHAEAGRNPDDRRLVDLVGELSTRSPDFRALWAAHDVLFHRAGARRFRHPVVGEVLLAYQDLDVPQEPDQTILVFTAEPGSSSDLALAELARSTTNDRRGRSGDQAT